MVVKELVESQGEKHNMSFRDKFKKKTIGIFEIKDIMDKRAFPSVALEDYAWIRFSDISSNLDEMVNEFPRIPDERSSGIEVHDFIIDIKIWYDKEWMKK